MKKISEEEKRLNWNNYQKEYRKNNKEKIKKYHDNWVIKKALKLLAEREKNKKIGV